MIYQEALDYLSSLVNYENIHGYSSVPVFNIYRITTFLKSINSPQKNLKAIHVAGTNGKGSICAFIAYILREAGFSAGLYTSPHLSSFRERIRILSAAHPQKIESVFEGSISQNDFLKIFSSLKPRLEKFNAQSRYGSLTFFEVLTIIALIYFKSKRTDFVVLETGLGGRLDATNVIRPLVCVISPIGYEHQDFLGKSLKEIATEKVGIIKKRKNLVTVSASQQRLVRETIENRCRNLGVGLMQLGKDISFKENRSNLREQSFDLATGRNHYKNLSTKMLGRHQLINASLAVAAIEELNNFDVKISEDCIRRGLVATSWPGRLELIASSPDILLDGAHNKDAAKVLVRSLKLHFPNKIKHVILGISKDKNIVELTKQIATVADHIIVTRSENARAAKTSYLIETLEKIRSIQPREFSLSACEDYRQAIDLTKKRAKDNELIVVTGSIFLIGNVRKYLKDDTLI